MLEHKAKHPAELLVSTPIREVFDEIAVEINEDDYMGHALQRAGRTLLGQCVLHDAEAIGVTLPHESSCADPVGDTLEFMYGALCVWDAIKRGDEELFDNIEKRLSKYLKRNAGFTNYCLTLPHKETLIDQALVAFDAANLTSEAALMETAIWFDEEDIVFDPQEMFRVGMGWVVHIGSQLGSAK